MNKPDAQIHALHRYFLWANRMRQHFRAEIQRHGPPPEDKRELRHWLIGPFGYFSMWMAMLYVVIEGWTEQELSHPGVAALLDQDRIALLKRYRNGVFHYQKDYFDRRFTEFFDEGYPIADWADDLHEQLSQFFLDWGFNRMETVEQSPGHVRK